MEIVELQNIARNLTLAHMGQEVFTESEIDEAKSVYELVMASVPAEKMSRITEGYTGTLESKRKYVENHWMWSQEDASRREFMIYSELAGSIAHMLDGTLGKPSDGYNE
jgi:hypothetical protein